MARPLAGIAIAAALALAGCGGGDDDDGDLPTQVSDRTVTQGELSRCLEGEGIRIRTPAQIGVFTSVAGIRIRFAGLWRDGQRVDAFVEPPGTDMGPLEDQLAANQINFGGTTPSEIILTSDNAVLIFGQKPTEEQTEAVSGCLE